MAKTSKYEKVMLSALIGAAGLLGVSAVQAEEITRGSIVAATCYTCHGTYGVSPGSIPTLVGIPANRMKTMLMEFRDKKRASTVMGRHASGYTDDEIAEVSEYFGKLQKRGD